MPNYSYNSEEIEEKTLYLCKKVVTMDKHINELLETSQNDNEYFENLIKSKDEEIGQLKIIFEKDLKIKEAKIETFEKLNAELITSNEILQSQLSDQKIEFDLIFSEQKKQIEELVKEREDLEYIIKNNKIEFMKIEEQKMSIRRNFEKFKKRIAELRKKKVNELPFEYETKIDEYKNRLLEIERVSERQTLELLKSNEVIKDLQKKIRDLESEKEN
jgi:hypothetical protein